LSSFIVVTWEVLKGDSEEDVVVNPLGYGTDSWCSEDVGSGISQETVNSSCWRKAKIVVCIDGELITISQPNDEPRPLFRGDRDGAISFRDVTNGSLGSGGEVPDSETYSMECAPSTGEEIRVDSMINWGYSRGSRMRVWKIMNSSLPSWLARFGNQRKRRWMKRANELLDLRLG
jgi:hypothetical protein